MKAICNIAAATILLFSSLAVAQTGIPTFTTGNLKLVDTTFQVGLYTEGNGAGCDTSVSNCDGAFSPLVAPLGVTCPARAGETCTFAVTVDAAGRADGVTEGVFRYVGDAQTTVAYAGDPNCLDGLSSPNCNPNTGFYMWSLLSGPFFSASHTFVALVKNTKNSQKHLVEIDLGCFPSGGQGSCAVQALGLFEAPALGSPVTVTIQVFRERKPGT
jgi:hypothetical protein